MGVLSLRILGRRGGWTAWAGCPGPGGRVQQETPGRGSGGPAFGEPRPPRPFESTGVSGALVGPEAPVGAESGLCGLQAAPRRHLGCRNRASGSQHSSCVSEGPSGLTLLPAASSLLHSLCSRGRWAGAGCVPLGAGPGGSRLCSPVLLGGGAVRKLRCQSLPRACPAILEGSGFLSHVPGGILAPLASSRRPPRPALATCQVSRRHQGLERRAASGWEPCPVTRASPVTAGAAAFPPACPWLLLQGTPPHL